MPIETLHSLINRQSTIDKFLSNNAYNFVELMFNFYVTVALSDIRRFFLEVKHYGLKIGYKMAHKMKTGG